MNINTLFAIFSEIMSLANRMTYNDKLECISDKVAQSSVKIEQDFLESVMILMY